jgi:hypothetical protein
MLLCGGLGELVSVMEHNLGGSMYALYELFESWFWRRIGVVWSFQGSEGL